MRETELHEKAVGLCKAQVAEVLRLGSKVRYETEAKQLIRRGRKVVGVARETPQGTIEPGFAAAQNISA